MNVPSQDLTIQFECPPVRVESEASAWVEYRGGPRTTITIHGLNDRVKPYLRAVLALAEDDKRSAVYAMASPPAPQRVYVVEHDLHEGFEVLGIFATQEAAVAYIGRYQPAEERLHCGVLPFDLDVGVRT